MASTDDQKMACGPSCPFLGRSTLRNQPPKWKTNDIALWCEQLAGRGQCFSTVLVAERAVGETTPGPTDSRAFSRTDGASTFVVVTVAGPHG